MGSKTRTVLVVIAVTTWGGVYLVSVIEHFQVPSQFDTALTTLVGAVLLSKGKNDRPKD